MNLKRLLEIRRRKEELRSLVDSKEATTEQINAAIAEECLAAENEAFEITQQNLKKGTDDASDGKAWGNLLC